jgi:hypothetical protein
MDYPVIAPFRIVRTQSRACAVLSPAVRVGDLKLFLIGCSINNQPDPLVLYQTRISELR